MSAQCRSLPHGNHFSVTAYEKADAQILYAGGRVVPEGGLRGMEVGDNLRLVSVFRFTENPTHLATAYYC